MTREVPPLCALLEVTVGIVHKQLTAQWKRWLGVHVARVFVQQ
jgi:hypothetical protein